MDATRLKHRFDIGITDDDTVLAVSSSPPYFCFEGKSEAEVEATVKRALDFYYGIKGELKRKPAKAPSKSLVSFKRRRTVETAA